MNFTLIEILLASVASGLIGLIVGLRICNAPLVPNDPEIVEPGDFVEHEKDNSRE